MPYKRNGRLPKLALCVPLGYVHKKWMKGKGIYIVYCQRQYIKWPTMDSQLILTQRDRRKLRLKVELIAAHRVRTALLAFCQKLQQLNGIMMPVFSNWRYKKCTTLLLSTFSAVPTGYLSVLLTFFLTKYIVTTFLSNIIYSVSEMQHVPMPTWKISFGQ